MNDKTNLIFDVTGADFAETVIARSQQIPVLVDFWAQWCAPCRTLGPVLEAAVIREKGRIVLARVDVDAENGLAAEYGIQSIPTVKIFSGGKVVEEFSGALPAEEIDRLLFEFLPDPAEGRIGEANRSLDAGRWEEAERIYQSIRDGEPSHPGAALGLGLIAYHQGRYREADELLSEVTPQTPGYDQVAPLRGRIYFQTEAPPDMAAITAALEADPADPGALYDLALAYGRGGEYLRALDTLIEVLSVKKDYGDGKAREAYLRLLAILGRKSADGKLYERKLSMLLFS